MKRLSLLFLLFFIAFANVYSQDSLLIEKFKAHSYPLHFENGQLSGKGFDFLSDIGQQTPFFLIGESHGMAEIPKFTASLFQTFKKYGYQYFATETGPYTAEFLQMKASDKNMNQEMQSFLKEYPASIPFYSWKEECAILEAVMNSSPSDKNLIWGLDQEFAAAPRMILKRLAKNATTEESRLLAKEYLDKAVKSFEESASTKNPGKAFMAIVQPTDFEKLNQGFAGQSENLDLIKEMKESIHIYQLWFQREGYQSNLLRAEMMKRHFWQYYTNAKKTEANPKVMFKFGAYHMYRGASALNVFDIGNFVSELASQTGTSSFHLYTLGKKGTQNTYTPFSISEADKQTKYDANDFKKVDFSTILKSTPNNSWSIVDLRPLRKELFGHAINEVDPGLEKLIWSYDAILVFPEVTASTMFE